MNDNDTSYIESLRADILEMESIIVKLREQVNDLENENDSLKDDINEMTEDKFRIVKEITAIYDIVDDLLM